MRTIFYPVESRIWSRAEVKLDAGLLPHNLSKVNCDPADTLEPIYSTKTCASIYDLCILG